MTTSQRLVEADLNAAILRTQEDKSIHPYVKDITGLRFGRLVVMRHIGRKGSTNRNHYWAVMCDCGNYAEVIGSSLRCGETRSCGCLQRHIAKAAGDRTRTHGLSGTSTYAIWDTMVQRCTNSKSKNFKAYGGRGIKVCDRWRSFDNFLRDMGERPDGQSLDRWPDKYGNYEPGNCRWATSTEQARNKLNNRILSHEGRSLCVAEWADLVGMCRNTLFARLRRGWSVERSLSDPVDMRFSRE